MCVRACVRACVRVCVCMCVYLCVFVCMYVCVFVCMYVCVCIIQHIRFCRYVMTQYIAVTAVLRDFTVWMSVNDPAVPPSDGTVCGNYSGPQWHVGVSHVTCVQPPVLARYVTLIAYGNHMILMLCEVQVFGQRT